MDEQEKPITDKENFPDAETKRILFSKVVPIEECAYLDGVNDGYRKAVTDFMLYAILFFVVAILARVVTVEV